MMPNNALSSTPVPGNFLPPRTQPRVSAAAGTADQAYGGVAIGDASQGIRYQVWTAYADPSGNLWLEAPNTAAYEFLPGVGAAWVALAFDQSARIFLAWSTSTGAASYYWYDSTITAYRVSTLVGYIPRIFASLDDARPAQSTQSDILLVYELSGQLYMRQQRDRFGVAYDLGTAPSGAPLAQIGPSTVNRFQFAFKSTQGNVGLPPVEYQLNVGGVINVP